MALLKNDRLVEDTWTAVDSVDAIGSAAGENVLVPLELWQAHREQLQAAAKVGIVLPNDVDPDDLAAELESLSLIVLDFPAMGDGRGFSQARILRDQLGFGGEIRARGPLIADQYFYLLRCGVDAVEVPGDIDTETWLAAARRYTAVYQPAADARVPAYRLRGVAPRRAAAS